MAQIKNSRKSEGLCEKIHNAVSPFRSRNRRISHESSLNKMIPVEFNHLSAENTKKLVALSPAVQSAGQEKTKVSKVQEFDDREILIIRGQKFSKNSAPEKDEKLALKHARFGNRFYKDDELVHEGKFSEYISKVKNRMMKTASHVERNISFK